jgi:tetratricopeptide (TPR) repeat protein
VAILLGLALGGWWWRWAGAVDPLQRGRAAYGRGDYPSAEREARGVLRSRREDADALRLLARCLFRQRRDRAALNVAQQLPRASLGVEDYFLQGQAFFRLGQKERAILLWRAGLGLDRHHLETILALEQAFSELDLLHEAATMAQLLAAEPGWEARAALRLAAVRADQSDPGATAEALERALTRPDQWHGGEDPVRVRKRLIRCLLQTGQPGRARTVLEQLLGPLGEDSERGWLLSRCDLQEGVASLAAVSALAWSYRQAHPLEPEPAPFLGEARCATCHPAIFRTQHRSRHARTFIRKEHLEGAGIAQRSIADPGDPRVLHAFVRRSDGWEIQTRAQDHLYQSVVDFAFGSGDRGLTLVGHDREERPYECRLSRYPEPFGWDVTSGQPPQPDQPALFQGMRINRDAVRRCLFCHTTHAQAILAGSGPESADSAIGCERCHGPGGHHVQAVRAERARAAPGESDLAIARPSVASGAPIVALCSQCHSPRDKNLLITPGAPDSVRFQGRTLTWSRCYSESGGQLDCVTCHDPHRDAETAPAAYVARCLACHGATGSKPSDPARRPQPTARAPRGTCPVQPEGNCIMCHMPKIKTPMAHAEFTDHFIRVHPDPPPSQPRPEGSGGEDSTAR